MANNLYNFDLGSDGVLTDAEALRSRLNVFFSVSRNEFMFRREVALDLEAYLFMPFTATVAQLITIEIEDGLSRFFPNLSVTVLNVTLDLTERRYNLDLVVNSPNSGESVAITRRFKTYA